MCSAISVSHWAWSAGYSAVRSLGNAAFTISLVASARTSSASLATAVTICFATDSGLTFSPLTPAAMSVSMKPACTATTRVPCRRSSMRSAFVSDHAADFDALYVAPCGIEMNDSTDSTLTRAPPPLSRRIGAKARATRIEPK